MISLANETRNYILPANGYLGEFLLWVKPYINPKATKFKEVKAACTQ